MLSSFLEDIYLEIVFFILCILQPICLPVPETATILGGSVMLGSFKTLVIGMAGTLTGISIMYGLSKFGSKKLLKKFTKNNAIEKYQEYVQNNTFLITGLLFIIPVLPDEIICLGAGFSKISYRVFIGIAAVSKLISISMVAYSEEIGMLFSLSRIEIMAIELVILFAAAYLMKRHKRRKIRGAAA